MEKNMYFGAVRSTVIDYVLGDKEVRKSIKEMKIGYKVDSDHHSVEVVIKGTNGGERAERGIGFGEEYGTRKVVRNLSKGWEGRKCIKRWSRSEKR